MEHNKPLSSTNATLPEEGFNNEKKEKTCAIQNTDEVPKKRTKT